MTEAEWLGADSPLGMLGWLCEERHYLRQGPVSDRKVRLFACACCRAAWHLLSDERSRRAVEAAERLADGRGMPAVADLNAASLAVGNWAMDHEERVRAAKAAYFCLAESAYISTVCGWLSRSVPGAAGAGILRDVVGNPFRPAAMDPALPNWCEVAGLAEAAYDERLPGGALEPARLAVLADALEDAGCAEEALLRHLRGEECVFMVLPGGLQSNRPVLWRKLPVPHYRGCWALDLILGLS